MRINSMRRVDYYLGIPICILFSIVNRSISFFRRKVYCPNYQKVLFIKLWGMGSIILCSPAVKEFKKQYPFSRLYFMTFSENRAVCELLGLVDSQCILTIDESSVISIVLSILRNITILRKEKIDVVIDMEFFSRTTAIISFLIGSVYRVGFCNYHTEGLYRGNFLTHPVVYNCYRHISTTFLGLVRPLGVETKEEKTFLPKIKINTELKRKVFYKLKKINYHIENKNKLVIINVNSTRLTLLRRWPRENFISLADRIIEYNNRNILLFIGSREDRQYVTSCIVDIKHKENVINLSGKTSIRELIALYYSSKIFITNDSGSAHLASLTDINIFVFFGPETPLLYRPLGDKVYVFYKNFYCSPCITLYNGKYSICKDNQCLKAISVDEVFNKIARFI